MQDLLPFITHFRSAYNFSNASTVAATFLWTFLSCTTRKPVWKFRKQRAKGLRTHTAITRASPFWVIARRNWEQVSTPIYLSLPFPWSLSIIHAIPFPEPRAPPREYEKTPRLGRVPVSLKSWYQNLWAPELNFQTKSLEKITSFPGFSPISRSVGRCHSDMGIPAFWASPFPYP